MEEQLNSISEQLKTLTEGQKSVITSIEEMKGQFKTLTVNTDRQQTELNLVRQENAKLAAQIAMLKFEQTKNFQKTKVNALEIRGIHLEKMKISSAFFNL